MKSIKHKIIGAVAVIFTSAAHTLAIEGLNLSLQCSNVVLSWPSTNDEIYIVQYRPTLDPSTPWQTLTSSLPADLGTNLTFFVHSNIVQNPNCSGSLAGMGENAAGSALLKGGAPRPPEPLAMRAGGSSRPVPLRLYPPGFDLSDFLIFDPVRSEWFKGSPDITAALSLRGLNDPEPQDGPGDDGPPPETGFYRVVRNGVHLVGITNGITLSGTVTIPVEVGAEEGTLVALSVREDGSPAGKSPSIAPFQVPLHVVLDTTAMSNGVHEISGFASWRSGGDEDGGSSVDAESPAITVNVYNEITFPGWIEHYGELYDSVLITAQSAHPDADWWVDIYGSDAGYIGTFAGHTTDGNIYGWWDLVGPPPTYPSYASERYFDFVVTTEYEDGPATASAASPPMRSYRQTDNWTSKGMWVVANMQAWEGTVGHDLLDIASDGFAGMAEGFSLTVRPSRPAGESFRIGFGPGIPASTRNAQWSALRSALFHQESRNFFYLGHGAPDGIGAADNTNRFIKATEIAGRLFTIPAGQTNRHGYRFVLLYGCETASGTLPESFGMIHRENVPGIDFANAALTPGAFIGWNHNQSAAILSSVMTDNAFYIQHFQLEWTLNGLGVSAALDAAKNNYPDVGFINRSKLKVFGNWDLRPLSFNR